MNDTPGKPPPKPLPKPPSKPAAAQKTVIGTNPDMGGAGAGAAGAGGAGGASGAGGAGGAGDAGGAKAGAGQGKSGGEGAGASGAAGLGAGEGRAPANKGPIIGSHRQKTVIVSDPAKPPPQPDPEPDPSPVDYDADDEYDDTDDDAGDPDDDSYDGDDEDDGEEDADLPESTQSIIDFLDEQQKKRDEKWQKLLDALHEQGFLAEADEDACATCGSTPPPTPPCCVTMLEVECGHSGRGFTLIPPDTKTNEDKDQVIQCVADKASASPGKGAVDKIKVKLKGGPCNRGKDGYPYVKLAGENLDTSGEKELAAPSAHALAPLKLREFMRLFLVTDASWTKKSYKGSVVACEGVEDFGFRVDVFPKRKWEGKVNLKLDIPKDDKKSSDLPFDYGGEISYQDGHNKSKVELPKFFGEKKKDDDDASDPSSGFTGIVGMVMVFYNAFDMLASEAKGPSIVSTKVKWPNVELGGGAELVEAKGKWNTHWEGKVFFRAAPLIGMEFKVDILGGIIYLILSGAASPAAGEVFLRIRKVLEGDHKLGKHQPAKVKMRIDLIATGDIKGHVEWKWKFATGETDDEKKSKGVSTSGEIGGEIKLQVKGELSGELKLLIVSVSGGYQLTAESAVGAKLQGSSKKGGVDWKGQVYFKGLTIKGVFSYGVAGSFLSGKKEGKSLRKHKGKGKRDIEHFNIKLIDEYQWPKKKDSNLAEQGAV